MLPILVLLFVSSTLGIAINSSPGSLLQPRSNVSSLLSSLNAVSPPRCAVRSIDYRHNVRAIDCLNLFTFILATEDHTKEQTFTVALGAAPGSTVYSRKTGTCKLGLLLTAGTTAVVSSFDEILQAALRVVGLCLLDNRPDSTHWGGVVAIDKLLIGVAGLVTPSLGNQPSSNETSTLGKGFGTWFEGLADS